MFYLSNASLVIIFCFRFFETLAFEIRRQKIIDGENDMLELRKTSSVSEKEKRLLQRKAKLESDLARLQKAARDASRRDDTRRKIVIGAAFLKAIQEGKISEDMGPRLVASFATDRDKKLFDGFIFKLTESSEVAPVEQE
ncbi:hypothetical protein LH464_22910 [Neorhizobium sp. T786]|uniref:hypothetical protein n=1 Tax=Pseudorhizobium xiangyangii TaxID=2883104 RepID=UPI001CFFD540|nr:hypothetical protein [Neorhizobium xiangyangii]MCB5205316.1 hypothetical protein [Neorhizobium xiangyangii]